MAGPARLFHCQSPAANCRGAKLEAQNHVWLIRKVF